MVSRRLGSGIRWSIRTASLAEMLPREGYLCGERFTVADVLAGYSLRLARRCELVDADAIEPYFGRLVARDAARESRVFASA